ncbi:MAG: hypothetical protein WDZ35_06835 [Crocinitomicaceae bacterium]
MFPYHETLKERIQNNELIGYEVVNNYVNGSPRLLLYFESEPKIRPVLKHKIKEYKKILDKIETKFEQITESISPIIY